MSLRDDYVEALETENEELRARVANLEELLGMKLDAPLWINLTPQESRLFGILLKRDLVTKNLAMLALYGSRPDGDEPEAKIIDVFVCKLRAKLEHWNLKIETKWGQGWYMTAETKARAKSLMETPSAA